MAIPNFYKINFEREIVFQGNDTAFLTVKRNSVGTDTIASGTERVWVYFWVQPQTVNIDDTLENRDINIPFPAPPWSTPLNPNPYKYDADDTFFINGANATSFADKKQTSVSATPSTVNPTDGITQFYFFKSAPNFRWHYLNNVDDEITYRIDYNGIKDSHLKITVLFFLGSIPGYTAAGNIGSYLTPAISTLSPYGVKDNHELFPTFTSYNKDNFDYQEVHIFGYKESYVRPTRDIYQNIYKSADNPIYDDKSSYGILRTNPKLTGNIKLTVDSTGLTWLNTIDANDELSNSKYKRYPVSPQSSYQKDVSDFAGSIPPGVLFSLYQFDNQYLNTKRNLHEQYDNFYTYGVEQLNNKYYDEDFSFFAPIWLRKNIPSYFVILRIPHALDEESYNETISQEDRIKNYFAKGDIIKTFDLGVTSKVGSYLRKLVNDSRFIERPLDVSYERDNASTWNGIDYNQGSLTGKGEFLYDFFTTDRPIQEFEEYITAGFERNGIISSNLINLEFLFNDEEATPYSINRYVGFYVNENELANIEISGMGLQKNLTQTPAPKPGVDGEPYSNRDFVQTNTSGIVIPVHYYQGTHNQPGAEPEYTGTVNGKLPLTESVNDPLRIFYIKDREGNFKRIKEINEVEYGDVNTPNSITVSELKLGDKQENIALYGGVSEIVSQFDALLLDSGKSQLIINLENTNSDSQLILLEEELKIVQRKQSQPTRDFVYTVTITGSAAGIVTSLDWSESSTAQSKDVTYPFVGPAVVDLDSFLTVEFDPAVLYAAGDQWEISIINHEITINNLSGSTGLVVKPVPQYEEFTWRMIANPIGLPVGGAFRYPTYDPNGYNNLSHFNPEGTPTQVAKAITECINSFENRIVDAYYSEGKIILKSKVPFEDGNTIAFVRQLQNDSVFDNVTFYESGLVTKDIIVSATPGYYIPNTQELNTSVIKFYEQSKYFSSYVYFNMSMLTLQVRLDVDPAFPTTTGTLQSYTVATTDSVNVYRNGELLFTIYTKHLKELFSGSLPPALIDCLLNIQSRSQVVEQNFVGGVRRNRARTRAILKDSQRYYYNDNNVLLRANPTKITQQWFQVQKDKYSLLKGWEVQGQYVYSLPYLDEPIYDSRGNISGYNRSDTYDIIQVDSYNDEFFQTRDKKIVAYKVYRPSVGIFSVFPIKAFDTDTIFSDYSYTPTPEVFRYYTTEKLVSENSYAQMRNVPAWLVSILALDPNAETFAYQKELALFENWRIKIDSLSMPLAGANIKLEGYDGVSNMWVDLETVSLNRFAIGDTFLFNTYFPVYFYNNTAGSEPNDTGSNVGPQYTMVGRRNYDKKTYNLERNVFTKARITILNAVKLIGPPPSYVETPVIFSVENNCYADDPDIKTFNGFAGLQDFTTAEDEAHIQKLRADNDPERFTYQLLLSEYDRLRENFTKEWAVKSKVVPYIQKWVQEGTDARDNYYRLNNSFAFGVTNFSPDSEVSFTEPLLLTHEFPYLDAFPKDYPVESVENSRLYQFNKLSDRVYDYELNVLEDSTNYFKHNLSIFNQDYKDDGYEKNYFYIEITGVQISTYEWSYTINVWKYVDLNNFKTTGINIGQFTIDSTNNYVFEDKEYKIDLTNYKTSGTLLFSVQSSDPRTWYDILKTDTTDDWFTKYFAIGCPTELLPIDILVPKNREERYTFFNFNTGIGKSQSLFHGAKVQVVDVDSNTLVEVVDSNKFINYKFSAVARVVRKTNLVTDPKITFDKFGKPIDIQTDEPPFIIEVIKNDIHKSILMIITINQNDYRLQSGGSEFTFFYAAINEMKTHMQSQSVSGHAVANYLTTPSEYPYQLQNMYDPGYYFKDGVTTYENEPYTPGTGIPAAPTVAQQENYWYQVSRLRNGFMGGGYLELGDPKLRSIGTVIDLSPITPPPLAFKQHVTVTASDIKPGYGIPLYNDIFQITEVLPDYKLMTSAVPLFGNTFSTIKKDDIVNGYYKFGYYNRIYTTSYKPTSPPNLTYYSIVVNPDLSQTANVDYNKVTFYNSYSTLPAPFGRKPVYMRTAISPVISSATDGTVGTTYTYTMPAVPFPNTVTNPIPGETFHLYGGAQIIDSKKLEYTFSQIVKLINSDNTIQVEYSEISETYVGPAKNYKLRFVSFDRIAKSNKYYFSDDTDKPTEYANYPNIGRDFVLTPERETVFRHRGLFEPKTNEILSFWVREDELFTSHYKKDYVLKNTRINNLNGLSGIIRNLVYNKVADAEVLKISQGSSYKSLYPYINEIAIDKGDQLIIQSTWDDKYYKKYTSTTDYTLVAGIKDMTEFKSFLASKVMNVPKSFDIQEFTSDEIKYQVIKPGTDIGVDSLSKGGTISDTRKQINQDGNKPQLVITLDLAKRLLRQFKEDLLNPLYEDEFLRLTTLSPIELSSLTPAEIETLKNEYFTKNIIPLYQVGELNLWLNTNEGFPVLDLTLSEVTKKTLGYTIDKNCLTQQNKNLQYTITKNLDTKQAEGFSISVLLKRI